MTLRITNSQMQSLHYTTSLCDKLISVLSALTPDIQCRIDRRNTLADLKKTLEQHVGQTSDNFKVLRYM